jgi:two-component sensor histidine kinase
MSNNTTVLIIDDSDVIRTGLKKYFEKGNYNVITATDGEDGINIIREKKTDVIISDILMPKMTGIELLSLVKKEYPNLPFIILSAVDNIDFAIKALKLGAWDFISKTDENMEMMLFTVENALEKARIIKENNLYKDELERMVKDRTGQLEVAMREIHHRVKNNLQMIISMIRLQMDKLKQQETMDFINSLSGRIRSIALVHEQLYAYEDIANIQLKQYVTDLVGFETQFFNSVLIKINIEIEDISVDIDTAIPLGILLNELISNSFKYAFPEKSGIISLLIKYYDDKLWIYFSDNGVGIKDDIDINNPKTLGFQLINTLIKQLRAEMKVFSNKGTKYEIISEINLKKSS